MTYNPLSKTRVEAYRKAIKEPFAFVGVDRGLGIAVANKQGYFPVPEGWAQYSSYNRASEHAEEINRTILGLTDLQETQIIFSTMGGQRYVEETKTTLHLLFGTHACGQWRDSGYWDGEDGAYVVKEFGSKQEADAYLMGVNDAEGWGDMQVLDGPPPPLVIEIYPMKDDSYCDNLYDPEYYDVLVRYDGCDPIEEVEDIPDFQTARAKADELKLKYPKAEIVEMP